MKNIFQNSFYSIFRAFNADEIISNIENDNLLETKPDWAEFCRVKTYSLDAEKYGSLLRPSFKRFAEQLNKTFLIDMQEPWLNCYNRGGFQELHDHNTFDFSCYYAPGCTDPNFIQFWTQGFTADYDNGSCVDSVIYGCMDPTQFNYNPQANLAEGS